jgi:uncharacterized protein YcgI (DUF1989 family)
MHVVKREVAARNSGWASEIRGGQILRLEARTIIDFVAFDLDDPTECFDQARTKEASGSIYMRRGDRILSRSGLTLMRMLVNGFEGLGTHDMQFGLLSREVH